MMWHQQTSRRRDPSVAGFSQDLVLGFTGQPEQIQEAEPFAKLDFWFPTFFANLWSGIRRSHPLIFVAFRTI